MGLKISLLNAVAAGGLVNPEQTYFPIVYNSGSGLTNAKFALSSIWDVIEPNVADLYSLYKSEYYFGGGEGNSSGGGGVSAETLALIEANTLGVSRLSTAYTELSGSIANNSSDINEIKRKVFYIRILDPSGTPTNVYSYSPDTGLLGLPSDTTTPVYNTIELISGYRTEAMYRYSYSLSASVIKQTTLTNDGFAYTYILNIGNMTISAPSDLLQSGTHYTKGAITARLIVRTSWDGAELVTNYSSKSGNSLDYTSNEQYGIQKTLENLSQDYLNNGETIDVIVLFGDFVYTTTLTRSSINTSLIGTFNGDITSETTTL